MGLEGIFESYEFEVELAKSPGVTVAVATHGIPVHADDIFAMEMIAREATSDWVRENSINKKVLLDVPGSKFSDKQNIADCRKKEATCVKVARSLGLLGDPVWEKLIRYVNRDDLHGSSDHADLLTLLKRGQQQNPLLVDEIIGWFTQGIMAKMAFGSHNGDFRISHIADLMTENKVKGIVMDGVDPLAWRRYGERIYKLHQGYFLTAREELERKLSAGQVLTEQITVNGQILRVAAVESINYRMPAALRAKRDDNDRRFADIVIIKSPSGVLVTHDKSVAIDQAETAAALRFFEAVQSETLPERPDWALLRQPGTINIAPAWFLNTDMEPVMVMNSLSHDAPRTALSLKGILAVVVNALDEKRFHHRPEIANFCRAGQCKLGSRCHNWQIGLRRCVDIYLKEKKGGKEKM